MVIENLVRSLSLCYFQTRRRSSGAKNHETHTARDLYRCDTHAAACTVHQNSFGSVCLRRVVQRMIRRSIGDPDSCTLAETNFCRKGMHLVFQRECVFSIRTAKGLRDIYAVPSLHFFDAFANRLDDAGDIARRALLFITKMGRSA